MEAKIITTKPLFETRTPTYLPPPDNLFSQKLPIEFFQFMHDYLSQQDLKALHCVDKYWNEMSINWLNSEASNENKWLFAAQSGDLEAIKSLIKTNPELLKITNNNGDNACHIAVDHDHMHLADFFQDHSNLMTQANKNGYTPFHQAIETGKSKLVKHFCDKDPAIIRSTTGDNTNGLQWAVLANQHEIFKLLYPYAKDLIHSKYEELHNFNMLQLAITAGDYDTIEWLIKKYPSQLSEKDDKGLYPVHVAVSYGNLKTIEIIDKERPFLIQTHPSEGSALHISCNSLGNFDVFNYVYQKLPSMRMAFNAEGYTPFHLAVAGNQLKIVNFYIQNHSKIVSVKTKNGFNALHLANTREMTEILYNLEPGLFEQASLSPLLFAARKACPTIVEFYLDKYPHLYSLKDNVDNNLLHLAAKGAELDESSTEYKKNQYKLVMNLASKYPQLLQEKNKHGKLPFMYAREYISEEVASDMVLASLVYSKKQNAEKSKSQQMVSTNLRDPNFVDAWTKAVDQGDTTEIKFLIQKNPEAINIVSNDGNNIAHTAVHKGHINMVEFLCAYPHLFTQSDGNNRTPFNIAISLGNVSIVKFLWGKGGGFKTTDKKWNPLYIAAIAGQYEVFETIYKLNPKLITDLYADFDNCNILHFALEGGNDEIVKSICKKCPSLISKPTNRGLYPIHDAITLNKIEIVKSMDKKCPSVMKLKIYEGTALHHACKVKESFDVFEYIYNSHPSMRMTCMDNKDKYLPFHFAITSGNFKIVEFYTKRHKEILHKKTANGYNPLHIVQDLNMAQHFYKLNKKFLYEIDKDGFTPLHLAAKNMRQDIVEFYLDCDDAIRQIKAPDGKNILHLAACEKSVVIKEKQNQLVWSLTCKYPELLLEKDSFGLIPCNYALSNQIAQLTLDMMKACQEYQEEQKAKNLPSAPIESIPIAIAEPRPTDSKSKGDKSETLTTGQHSKKKGSQITANSVKNEKKDDAHQHISSAPQTATETKEAPTLEIDSVKVSPTDEKKVDQLPQELPLDQNASSTTPKESYFNEKTEKSETEPAVVQRTKKPSTIERMRLKAVSTWNNTVGLSSAEKTKRREERKLLHRESISVSQSDWSHSVQSEWSQTIQSEVSEVEKSLAEGKYEPLVCALLKDSGIKLDQEIILNTLEQLKNDGKIELKYRSNKIRATFLGACDGKRPSLTIHTHNHDKPWYEQYKVQYNFLTFIGKCGLNTDVIKMQHSGSKNNTNDVAPDAGEG